jgi:hypothetical protein
MPADTVDETKAKSKENDTAAASNVFDLRPATPTVLRTATLPLASSGGDLSNQELLIVEYKARLYDEQAQLIERYCYRKSKEIDLSCARVKITNNPDDYDTILRDKSSTWELADRLSKVEKELGLGWAVGVLFCLKFIWATTAGILLGSLTNDLLVFTGALMLYAKYFPAFLVWAARLFRDVFRLGCNNDLERCARLLAELRDKRANQ